MLIFSQTLSTKGQQEKGEPKLLLVPHQQVCMSFDGVLKHL
jgi:hypothetical protein